MCVAFELYNALLINSAMLYCNFRHFKLFCHIVLGGNCTVYVLKMMYISVINEQGKLGDRMWEWNVGVIMCSVNVLDEDNRVKKRREIEQGKCRQRL